MQDEEILRAEAYFLRVPETEYLVASIPQRASFMARFKSAIRRDARRSGMDEEKAIEIAMVGFPTKKTQKMSEQRLIKTSSAEIVEARRKKRIIPPAKSRTKPVDPDIDDEDLDEDEDEAEEEDEILPVRPAPPLPKKTLGPSHVIQGDTKVYFEGGEIPPGEINPEFRDGVSVGPIDMRYQAVDLVGDKAPRTLTDLYSRWPIEVDHSYFIRIERLKPKRYGGVDVAGLVAEIRGRVVNEADLQRMLGGTEYSLVLYGPDPRGKKDVNDQPVVKPLTEPFKLTVPVLPPVISAVPAFSQKEAEAMNGLMNPFGAGIGVASPMTNQHDASIHKTNTEFATNMLKIQKAEEDRKDKEVQEMSSNMLKTLVESQRFTSEAMREEARERQRLLERQLDEANSARKEAEKKMDHIAKTFEEKTGKGFDVESMTRLFATMGPNREAESQRVAEHYRSQMELMKSSHEDTIKRLTEQHSIELRRGDERLKDSDTFHKRLIEEERAKGLERERELRSEIEKIRREERELAQQRLAEMKERNEAEVKNLERSHEREIRSFRENFDTKITVADRTHTLELSTLKERLEEAQSEAERIKEEAKETADPVRVLERARSQAEALGYQKSDDTPKTAMDRFMTIAGSGLSQALATINDWGPKMMASRSEAQQQAARMTPPARRLAAPQAPQNRPQLNPAQAQQAQQTRRAKAVSWATENVSPVTRPVVPETPLGFQTEEKPSQGQAPQEQAAPQHVDQPQTQPAEENANPWNFPEKFLKHFSPEAMAGFLMQVDTSINSAVDPTFFAAQFKTTYPEAAATMVKEFTPEDVRQAVSQVPNSESSSILRKDGKTWLEKLWTALKAEQS